MSVEDPNVIDFVTQDSDGTAVLVLVEGRPWDGSRQRLLELEEKLGNYDSYVFEGRLAAQYPALAEKPVVVELRCVSQPDPITADFIEKMRARLREKGLVLVVRQIGARPSA